MKRTLLLRTIALCMTGALLTGSLMARQASSGSSSDPSSSGSSSSGSSSSPYGSSSSGLSATGSSMSSQKPERLSQIMGATVKGQSGDTLGQINDFIVNPASGRIQFAILSLSDQSGKLTAVPWPLLKPGSDPSNFTLNVDKQKLSSAQTFDASSFPDFSQPSTSQKVYSYYGIQLPGRMGGGGAPGGSESGGGSSSPGGSGSSQPPSGSSGGSGSSGSSSSSGSDTSSPK